MPDEAPSSGVGAFLDAADAGAAEAHSGEAAEPRRCALPDNPWRSDDPLDAIVVLQDYCIRMKRAACERCALACPHDAISYGAEERPLIDRDRCTRCGICQGICDAFASPRITMADLHSRMRRIAIRGDEVVVASEACLADADEAADNVVVLPSLAMLSPEFWALLLAEGTRVSVAGDLETVAADPRSGSTGDELFNYAVQCAETWTERSVGYLEDVPLRENLLRDAASPAVRGRRELIDDLLAGAVDIASGQRTLRRSNAVQDFRERRERLRARNRITAAEGPKVNRYMPNGRLNQVMWPKRRLLLEAIDCLPAMAERVEVLLSRTDADRCTNCLACVAACPAKARFSDPETGALLLDSRYCIGCELCAPACPTGAVFFESTDATELLAS
ncbi:4Fe-4S dicluster domain-containing protein [Eggerthellaceae bacterium zg-893]|nr:4Fe-4S dicluster domain-containing protein [Eggerthellaceae bacterium zg-893]